MVITRSKAVKLQPALPGSPMRTARQNAMKTQQTTKKQKIKVSPNRFFKYLDEKKAKRFAAIDNNSHSESQLSVTPRRELLDFTNPFDSDTSLETSQCSSSAVFKQPARLFPQLRVAITPVSTPRPGTPMPSPEKKNNPTLVIIKKEPIDY
mgnify:CR=1 FL=1